MTVQQWVLVTDIKAKASELHEVARKHPLYEREMRALADQIWADAHAMSVDDHDDQTIGAA